LIFLSYAEEDTDVARTVRAAFRAEELSVYDWQEADGRGGRFIETVENKIRAARFFIALVSRNFLASTWCRWERELAMLREIDLTKEPSEPPFIHVLKVEELPFEHAGFLRIYDWTDRAHLPDLVRRLAAAIGRARPGQRPMTEGPVSAISELSVFRNRQEELRRVQDGLTNPAGPHFWLVTAPPQLGKTWFMDRISVRLPREGDRAWTTKLVDLREYPRDRLTDTGLLLAQLFGHGMPASTTTSELVAIAQDIIRSRTSHLCLLDSAELLNGRTATALRSHLSRISHYVQEGGDVGVRLAVIIGSRRDDHWRGIVPDPRLEPLKLTEFTLNVVEDAVRALARQMGREFEGGTYRAYAKLVHRLSEGLPALLVRCLRWIEKNQWVGMPRLEEQSLFIELAHPYIEERLLSAESLFPGSRQELAGLRGVLDEAFRVLSPYRPFTQSHLRHHLSIDRRFETAMRDQGWAMEDLWQAITGTALLLRPHDEIWQELQGAIRRLLYRYYHTSDEDRVNAHRQAREFVETWSAKQTGKEQVIGLVECLWHEATVLRLTRPEQLHEELSASAERLCGSLLTDTYSAQELRNYTAGKLLADDELAEVVATVSGLLHRLAEIARGQTEES